MFGKELRWERDNERVMWFSNENERRGLFEGGSINFPPPFGWFVSSTCTPTHTQRILLLVYFDYVLISVIDC